MPPKPKPNGNTSTSTSSSSNSSSSDSSSSSSSGSESSSDTESSQNSKKSQKNLKSKSPGKASAGAATVSSAEKSKKKGSTKKTSGIVINKNPRPHASSNSETEAANGDSTPAKKKSASKKASLNTPKPKVVPKKSATAKTIQKGVGKAKSNAFIDTESDSELDDSMSYSMTKLTQKEQKNKKNEKNDNSEKLKKSPKKKSNKHSKSNKASEYISESNKDMSNNSGDDTDTSLIRDLPKAGKKSPSPPLLHPQKNKPKSSKTNQKSVILKSQKSKKLSNGSGRKGRNSSVESLDNSSLQSIDSLDSDSADSDSFIGQKNKKSRGKKPSSNMSSPKASMKMERPTTRKQTRGTAIKKSVHITGRRVDSSESESEQEDGGGSPNKKPSGSSINKSLKPRPQYPPIENRKCPVPGCDSLGHLSGNLDRHFTHDACPIYHNTTPDACKEDAKEWEKKDTTRKKVLAQQATKSPLLSPSSEQKSYLEKIKEERKVKEEVLSQEEEDEIPVTDRERTLKGVASNWDLAMFREAQAKASLVIEEQLKGLPDVKGTKYMEMGRAQMEVWYQAPYPEEYTVLPKIYVCEFCLKYMKAPSVMKRHAAKCVWKHPPGDEIYRKDKLSVFEVCGKKYKQYCQNLCLIAKSFLDHKTLYYDVEPFLFYVMTVADSEGCHIVGYFSKEKNSFLNYNVSCILTLPPYQRQGYGRLLIDFSYLLSKMEGKIGSPEKPLSDLGLISYRAYWKDILLDYLCNYPDKEISVKSISEEMGIQSYDIVSTLQYLGMIKYWRGKHVILKKEDIIADYMERSRRRARDKEIGEEYLKWKPYEPTVKEKRQAEQIKKKQEERQKAR